MASHSWSSMTCGSHHDVGQVHHPARTEGGPTGHRAWGSTCIVWTRGGLRVRLSRPAVGVGVERPRLPAPAPHWPSRQWDEPCAAALRTERRFQQPPAACPTFHTAVQLYSCRQVAWSCAWYYAQQPAVPAVLQPTMSLSLSRRIVWSYEYGTLLLCASRSCISAEGSD